MYLSLHCCQVRVMQAWQRSGRSPSGSPEGAYEGSREPRPPVRAGFSFHPCCHLVQCGLIWFTRTSPTISSLLSALVCVQSSPSALAICDQARGVTMYDDKYFFVNNPLNRYSISPRQNLKTNRDGSTDLYIQKDSPGSPTGCQPPLASSF